MEANQFNPNVYLAHKRFVEKIRALLDSKVQNLAIFKLTRNLQFSLHWVSHHVHLG